MVSVGQGARGQMKFNLAEKLGGDPESVMIILYIKSCICLVLQK